jgi:hypothetical protein
VECRIARAPRCVSHGYRCRGNGDRGFVLRSHQNRTGSRNRFRWRDASKQPTRKIANKKRAYQEDSGSDYLFDNGLHRSTFGSKDKASLTDSFDLRRNRCLAGGSPFYQYRSGSGNPSPHGHLPLAISRSTICIQTGSSGPGGEPP